MLGRVDIRLQFEDPIPDGVSARARPQLRTLQIVLEVVLVDLLTAKRSEDGSTPQRPDETELPRHEIEQRRLARFLHSVVPPRLHVHVLRAALRWRDHASPERCRSHEVER